MIVTPLSFLYRSSQELYLVHSVLKIHLYMPWYESIFIHYEKQSVGPFNPDMCLNYEKSSWVISLMPSPSLFILSTWNTYFLALGPPGLMSYLTFLSYFPSLCLLSCFHVLKVTPILASNISAECFIFVSMLVIPKSSGCDLTFVKASSSWTQFLLISLKILTKF